MGTIAIYITENKSWGKVKRTIINTIIPILGLLACDPGELPIDPVDRGNAEITQVEMGPDYNYQLYFDLGTNSLVAQNAKEDWDIGLIQSDGLRRVFMNSSRGGKLAYVKNHLFTDAISASSLQWDYDRPNGHLDSSAAGNYLDSSGYFVMDLGYAPSGSPLGYRKFKIDTTLTSDYSVRVGSMNGSLDTSFIIQHDPEVNQTCISLRHFMSVAIEPFKQDWDLHFTQYMHLFQDDSITTPYLVTGVLGNRHETQVAEIDSIAFENIKTEDALGLEFSTDLDVIGYDWKYYDFTNGYIVNALKVYIIRDVEGRYYKLHFTDFYNQQGEKGSPTFEFQEL